MVLDHSTVSVTETHLVESMSLVRSLPIGSCLGHEQKRKPEIRLAGKSFDNEEATCLMSSRIPHPVLMTQIGEVTGVVLPLAV